MQTSISKTRKAASGAAKNDLRSTWCDALSTWRTHASGAQEGHKEIESGVCPGVCRTSSDSLSVGWSSSKKILLPSSSQSLEQADCRAETSKVLHCSGVSGRLFAAPPQTQTIWNSLKFSSGLGRFDDSDVPRTQLTCDQPQLSNLQANICHVIVQNGCTNHIL